MIKDDHDTLYRDDMSYLGAIRRARTMSLKEIHDYWHTKYPKIDVHLWENSEGDKFYGIMKTKDKSADLCASTIGELISQGESFLRAVV